MSVLTDFLFPRSERRDWIHDDDDLWQGTQTSSGLRVNNAKAMQLSTVWACVRLLSNTVATLPTEIVVSIGSRRFPEYGKPSWLVSPDPADPTMTPTEHFAQVAMSLLLNGNSFTYCLPDVHRPESLIVLDPGRVDVKREGRRPIYDIHNENGQLVATVDPNRMLHGVWMRAPGALRGLNPIESARQAIGLGIVAEDFASRFFGQGAALSFGVEIPGTMTDQQRDDLRKSMRKAYAGAKNSHNIGVLTAGAKFVTGLGVTNEDAQFIESRKFQVEDICRWYGVPPHMVGSQEPGASSYNSVEQRSLEFREYAILPLVRRIEDAYRHLVEIPEGINAPNATAAFRFNLDGLARADLKTRYESYEKGILAGVLKPDEARAFEDLPPVPGGDLTYMQAQMVPLGTSVSPAQPTQGG